MSCSWARPCVIRGRDVSEPSRAGPLHLVVDLDGTLIRANSFRLWTVVCFALPRATEGGRYPGDLRRFASLYLQRLQGRIDHPRLKQAFVRSWHEAASGAPPGVFERRAERFAHWLHRRFLHAPVAELAASWPERHPGARRILATAAPRLYAGHFAALVDMEVVAADDRDLRGEAKLAAVRELLGGAAPFAVVTDHHDDLPLVRAAERVYLVEPTAVLMAAAAAEGVAWTPPDRSSA